MRPLTWMRAVRDSDLPTLTRTTAWAMGLRAGREGYCWPTYQQISDDIGQGRRTAIRHVGALVEAGWLMAAHRSNGHGDQSNSYLLTLPPTLWKTPRGGVSPDTPPVTPQTLGGVSPDTPQGVTPQTLRRVITNEVGTTSDTSPVDNPHLAAVIGLMGRQHRLPS